MLPLICILAVSCLVAGVQSECQDAIPNCGALLDIYCQPPYDVIASAVCPVSCGLCDDDNASSRKRSHHHTDWLNDCWDSGHNHLKNPFCALLTTTPKPTTPEPTTTTTLPPTTTTTLPPTTTTTMPTTTTTTVPPTTTARLCTYDVVNDTDIKSTDFGTDVQLIENSNITLNESVHLISDVEFCQGVCAQSVLNDGYECWAFTYSEKTRCYLYYYSRPLYLLDLKALEANQINGTSLYLKRCSNDPTTTPRTTTTTTPVPATMAANVTTASAAPVTTGPVATTPTGPGAIVTGPPSGPNGLVMVDQKTYDIKGLPSPTPNMCFFLNQTFAKGSHWKDSCQYDCQCFDVVNNIARCEDVCPHFTAIPDSCSVVKPDGVCCPELQCSNGTTSVNVTGSGDGEDCDNTIDQCDFYPDSACVGLYEPWAKTHCALRCGYCPGRKEACVDRISYCNLYELDTACKDYEGWARHNCKQSCAMCAI